MTCGSLHGVDQDPITINEDDMPLRDTFTCHPSRAEASTIEIDCGNGQTIKESGVYFLSAVCVYDTAGTYTVSCEVNDQGSVPHCVDTFILEVDDDGTRDFGVCGDGLPDDFESCDL